MAQAIMSGLTTGSIYVLLALGLWLIFGILGIVNFAHGEFYMIGGYFAYLAASLFGTNIILILIVTIVLSYLFGLILDKCIFHLLYNVSHYIGVGVTIGMSILLSNIILLIFTAEPREIRSSFTDKLINFGFFSCSLQRIFVIIITIVMVILLSLFIHKTTLGKAMRAITQDKEAAYLVGINVKKVGSVTIALSAALAGIGGALVGPLYLVYPTMGLLPCLKAFIVVIVGGVGDIKGIVVAGILLGMIESIGTIYISSSYKDVIAFTILILVLLIKPSGLLSKGEENEE